FDEPLSNLDAALRVHMRSEINELHRRLSATMIYVTHDQVEAMTLADTIVVMKAGRVEQADTPLELYHRPVNRFVAGFIGSPAMNFVTGRLDPGGSAFAANGSRIELPKSDGSALTPYLGKDVVLGIRPEDLGRRPEGTALTTRVEVSLVEPMGSETYVHCRLGE